MYPPTHRCKTCGALWRIWMRCDTGHHDGWNLMSEECAPCCDNAVMSDQITALTTQEVVQWANNQRPLIAWSDVPGDA